MEPKTSGATPGRPDRSASWVARAPGDGDLPESVPGSTPPPGAPDAVRTVFWEAYRHLFPAHSLAAQSPQGSLVISWSILDEPDARYPYAAPVMLRFDETLVHTMWQADARQRQRIAQNHEATLREGLRGYDPFARFPNARVITIG